MDKPLNETNEADLQKDNSYGTFADSEPKRPRRWDTGRRRPRSGSPDSSEGWTRLQDNYSSDLTKDSTGSVSPTQCQPPGLAESWTEIISQWPKTTLLIIGNEFCERFSFYGMRTVLTIYMLSILKFDENLSTSVYHGFILWCYCTPLLGMILADGYIGKFQTILWLSVVYTVGQGLLTAASTYASNANVHPWLDLVGLFTIGIGTGGIKPCVSAFGGDQFDPSQLKLLALYFSVFYFSINAGSTLSTILTPILRAIPCLDNDSCFPLAFGVPAILMVVATVFFLIGSFWYKKNPPKENVIFMVVEVTFRAIFNKFESSEIVRNHWLDHSLITHSCANDPKCQSLQRTKKRNKCHEAEFVDDLKGIYRLLVMFLPLPMFWALFDQTGSRWVLQGVAMNGRLWEGGLNIPPDQLQVVNAFLILIMIPLFQIVIYPLVQQCGVEPTPLRKMAFGGFLAAISYIVVGFIQLKVSETNPVIPASGRAHFTLINAVPNCVITAKGPFLKKPIGAGPMAMGKDKVTPAELDLSKIRKIDFEYGSGCPTRGQQHSFDPTNKIMERKAYYVVFGVMEGHHNITMAFSEAKLEKSEKGIGASTINLNSFVSKKSFPNGVRIAFCKHEDGVDKSMPCDPRQPDEFAYATFCADENPLGQAKDSECQNVSVVSSFTDLREGKWRAYTVKQNAPEKQAEGSGRTISAFEFQKYIVPAEYIVEFDIAGQGAVVSLTLYKDGQWNKHLSYYIVPKNGLTILWQLIPYIIITASEILISITGLEFSYSQSPTSLKACLQAFWLLTVAGGNAIVLVITSINPFENLASEMFFYAALMAAVMTVFTLLAVFYYDYRYYTEAED